MMGGGDKIRGGDDEGSGGGAIGASQGGGGRRGEHGRSRSVPRKKRIGEGEMAVCAEWGIRQVSPALEVGGGR